MLLCKSVGSFCNFNFYLFCDTYYYQDLLKEINERQIFQIIYFLFVQIRSFIRAQLRLVGLFLCSYLGIYLFVFSCVRLFVPLSCFKYSIDHHKTHNIHVGYITNELGYRLFRKLLFQNKTTSTLRCEKARVKGSIELYSILSLQYFFK